MTIKEPNIWMAKTAAIQLHGFACRSGWSLPVEGDLESLDDRNFPLSDERPIYRIVVGILPASDVFFKDNIPMGDEIPKPQRHIDRFPAFR
jgi:hypothetical protein